MRNSDRWITPAVIIVALLVGGVLVALLIAATAWLSARGADPDPMIKTVGAVVTGLGSLATLTVTLATRTTTAKTERNTGVLAAAVYDVADAMPRPGGPRHASPDTGATPVPSGS